MQPTNLDEVIQYIAKQEQATLANQIAEAQQKLITISYDKAASYTTVIIFGGYAGVFAIWQLARDHLSRDQALWSALLMLISLAAFVMFEVVKMVIVSRSIFNKVKILRTPEVRTNPQRLLEALTELDEAQHVSLGWFHMVWAVTVFVAVGCALGGAGVLGYAFISGLAAVRPNPSLERTSTGESLGPQAGVAHHPSSGPSASPASSAQLKR